MKADSLKDLFKEEKEMLKHQQEDIKQKRLEESIKKIKKSILFDFQRKDQIKVPFEKIGIKGIK